MGPRMTADLFWAANPYDIALIPANSTGIILVGSFSS